MTYSKAVALSSILLFMIAGASAIPELSVSRDSVNLTGNDSVYAGEVQVEEFQFLNENDSKKIYDVELENRPWIEWNNSVNGSLEFDLNESDSRQVSARISPPNPGLVNETMEFSYRYNDSGDLTSNKNFYPETSFLVNSSWRPTEISTNIFTTEYTLNLSEEESGVFQVVNEGNETAYSVEASGEYLDVSPSSQNVSGDEFFNYDLVIPKPDGYQEATNMTNQSYSTSIVVSGENFESKEIPITIDIPYREYEPEIEENGSVSKVLESFKNWCSSNPEECNITETVYKNRTVTVNNTPVYEANFSEEEIQSIVNNTEQSRERTERIIQEFQLVKQLMNTRFDNFNETLERRTEKALNQSEKAMEQSEQTQQAVVTEYRQEDKREKDASQLGIMIIGITVFMALLLGGGYALYRSYQRSKDYRVFK